MNIRNTAWQVECEACGEWIGFVHPIAPPAEPTWAAPVGATAEDVLAKHQKECRPKPKREPCPADLGIDLNGEDAHCVVCKMLIGRWAVSSTPWREGYRALLAAHREAK